MIDRPLLNKLNAIERPTYLAMAIVLVLLGLSVLWLNIFPPLQDYPYHLVRYHIIVNYWNEAYNFQNIATLSLFPTPYIITDYLVLALGQFFSVETSGKIILSIYIILLPASVFYLVHAWNRRNLVIGFFGFVFVFNWFFSMGFINFVLGIPFSLFALGYWWKHKEHSSWKTRLVLSLLILLAYLSHPFTFCFLLFILGILLVYCRIGKKAVLSDALAALPSLILLFMSLWRDLPTSGGVSGYIALIYSGLGDKLAFAFGKKLPYLTSYWIRPERYVLYAVALVAAGLLLRQLLRKEAWNPGAILIIVSMFLLYLVLPEHLVVPSIKHIAPRTLIFFLLLGLLLINAPDNVISRLAVASSLFGLSFILFVTLFISYQDINKQLGELNTAFKQIPENSRLSTWIDLEEAQFGRIKPAAMFGGYYYITRAGNTIPSIPNFGGPLRALQFKDQSAREKTLNEVFTDACERLYGKKYLIMVPTDERIKEQLAGFNDECKRSASVGNLYVYQYDKTPDSAEPASSPEQTDILGRLYKKGYNEDYEYLLILADVEMPASFLDHHQLVYSHGKIHVWRRL